MGKITFIPAGGLANRMRTIIAAITLSSRIGSPLRIIWFRDWALKCRFEELFEPLVIPNVTLKEADALDLILFDRPRRINYHIPFFFQKILFQDCIYEQNIDNLLKSDFDFEEWASGRNVFLTSYAIFQQFPNRLYAELFHPVADLKGEIERRCELFTSHTIGIHIRRTDNIVSINESPTELFIKKMEEEIKEYPDTCFYLATDSEEDKSILRSHFGERVITSEKKAVRDSVEGIKDAVVDLYSLSHTHRIYGSFFSSFSETASYLNGAELVILKQ